MKSPGASHKWARLLLNFCARAALPCPLGRPKLHPDVVVDGGVTHSHHAAARHRAPCSSSWQQQRRGANASGALQLHAQRHAAPAPAPAPPPQPSPPQPPAAAALGPHGNSSSGLWAAGQQCTHHGNDAAAGGWQRAPASAGFADRQIQRADGQADGLEQPLRGGCTACLLLRNVLCTPTKTPTALSAVPAHAHARAARHSPQPPQKTFRFPTPRATHAPPSTSCLATAVPL